MLNEKAGRSETKWKIEIKTRKWLNILVYFYIDVTHTVYENMPTS